jgi:hypothetical protein
MSITTIIELCAFNPETGQEILPDDPDGVNYPNKNVVLPKRYKIGTGSAHYRNVRAAVNAAIEEQRRLEEPLADVDLFVFINDQPLVTAGEAGKPRSFKREADRLFDAIGEEFFTEADDKPFMA